MSAPVLPPLGVAAQSETMLVCGCVCIAVEDAPAEQRLADLRFAIGLLQQMADLAQHELATALPAIDAAYLDQQLERQADAPPLHPGPNAHQPQCGRGGCRLPAGSTCPDCGPCAVAVPEAA